MATIFPISSHFFGNTTGHFQYVTRLTGRWIIFLQPLMIIYITFIYGRQLGSEELPTDRSFRVISVRYDMYIIRVHEAPLPLARLRAGTSIQVRLFNCVILGLIDTKPLDKFDSSDANSVPLLYHDTHSLFVFIG